MGEPIRSSHGVGGPGPPVLVIGCGFLGGHIARGLALAGLRVRVLSHSFAPCAVEVLDDRALIAGDAQDRSRLQRALRDVDEVIYCVGGLQPASAEHAPELDAALMLDPLRAVLHALAGRTDTRITFLSSGGAVYGDPDCIPVSERQPTRPIGAYGRVRLAAEQMLGQAHERDGICARILRCSNVYGEGQPLTRGQGAVGVFIDRISRGEPIDVFGCGDVVRDYIHVGDLVDAVRQLLGRHRGFDVINVGSGQGTSVSELIAIVERVIGRTAIRRQRPARTFDVQRVILDVTKLSSLISFTPKPLAAGVVQLVRSPLLAA